MSATAEVDQELVLAIIDQVWDSLLQSPALPWIGPEPTGGALCAQIALSGDWNGLVRLTCEVATAQRIAATMMSAEEGEELPHEDVRDAVGEVVNVVGGNFKGALGGTTALGLPVVLDGPELHPSTPASRYVLDWHGEPVVVEVFADDTPTTPEETGEAR